MTMIILGNGFGFPVGCVSLASSDDRTAAIHLLIDFWRFDAKEGDVDEFHWINEADYLSIAELAAIAREVWG